LNEVIVVCIVRLNLHSKLTIRTVGLALYQASGIPISTTRPLY
jgi:hypothetical protein